MSDDKGKKAVKAVVASPELIAAVKRDSEKKATPADYEALATCSDAQRRAARKAAGVKTRRGGFRNQTDVWVQRHGEDGAKKVTPFGWAEFGEIKAEVKEKGNRIKIVVVPVGQSPK